MFVDDSYSVSEKVSIPVNPNFNFKKLFNYSHATQPLIDFLKEGILNIEVWGRQLLKSGYTWPPNTTTRTTGTAAAGQVNRLGKQETSKEMLQEELAKHGSALMNGFKMNGRIIDPNKQSIIVELLLLKKQQARNHQRIVC